MKTVIIGAVAAGTKTAAKLKRECPNEDVIIYTKSKDISYAGCGLPYYVGGAIKTREELIVNSPSSFSRLTGVTVHTDSEVTALYPDEKQILVNGERVSYDNLVIAVGAEPIIPKIDGFDLDGVFTVRVPDDAIKMREYIKGLKTALVVGGGFIGLEMAENLMEKGLKVTLIDMAPQLLPNIFDRDMADFIKRRLEKKGVKILTNVSLNALCGDKKVVSASTSLGEIPCDIAVLSVGIRPATKFLLDSKIENDRGLILTNGFGETNLPDVYAVGDCASVRNRITKKPQWSAMGSTANIAGRALALTLSGERTEYKGCLGTGVIRLSENLSAARTGLTEEAAKNEGFDVETIMCPTDDKAHYYPDSSSFYTKLIADRKTHRLLGAQIIGAGAVDKMADIAVVGISMGLKIEDFITMDFAYAPPFSMAIHPFAVACSVLSNKLCGKLDSMTPCEYLTSESDSYTPIDVNSEPTIKNMEWLDTNDIDSFCKKHKKDEKLLLICFRGKSAYLAQIKLRAKGFTNTKTLEGGISFNKLK